MYLIRVSTDINQSKGFRISPLQSDLLDLSRWVAAFLVVIEHLRSFMFKPYETAGGTSLLAKAFYFFTNFGHPAVMVFFVMSGFLVGGKVLDRLTKGTFSSGKYGVDRVSRLYAVYVLALLLGAALDFIGYHYLNRFGLYDHSFVGRIAAVNQDFHANVSLPVFGFNLVMCQTVLGPVFGSNGPLWSLANEFWYYLAGPLLFMLLYRKGWRSAAASLGALAAILWFLPANILVYSLVWFMGAGLYYMNSRRYLPMWLTLPVFLACFGSARLQWLKTPYLADFLIAISFALLINSAAGYSRRLPWHSISRKAADFSYSVYLCHFPFVVFALSCLYRFTGFGLQSPGSVLLVVSFLGLLALVYAWCYLVSLATERQTPRIRERLYRMLPQAGIAATPRVLG